MLSLLPSLLVCEIEEPLLGTRVLAHYHQADGSTEVRLPRRIDPVEQLVDALPGELGIASRMARSSIEWPGTNEAYRGLTTSNT